ncbi:hypothetical protein HBI56_158240 [Parastagonospora nodorum]|nr:hypothetical protein HBI10_183980 [Parastagonospora nodorum]KAH4014094.1 hypothetical protein HBI13_176080 [Parastagonospora nodorum]KAH4021898.1 hypothetical protein HBI09_173540 [Parastagonospora nodorum]KAH4117933.1 hypothetical protein HBH47_148720 [Parastagonospora nodorum]KAH4178956.1 hypothetical protein HBH43_030920 [Parastagonospora nodorum]
MASQLPSPSPDRHLSPPMHPHPPSHSHLPTSHLFNQPKPTLHINLLLPYCERSLLQHYCHNVAAGHILGV